MRQLCLLISFVGIWLCLTGSISLAEQFVSCHDGDTCRFLTDDGQLIKVRFQGIDAPELSQPYGRMARDELSRLLQQQGQATLLCNGQSYDRRVCRIYLQEGQDVEAWMVASGYAWDYPTYSKGRYSQLQQQAQLARRGLWQQPQVAASDLQVTLRSPFCWRWPQKPVCQQNPLFEP